MPRNNLTRRSLHPYNLRVLTSEKGILDIYPKWVLPNITNKQGANNHIGNPSKCLIIVNTILLRESTGHQPCFPRVKCTIQVETRICGPKDSSLGQHQGTKVLTFYLLVPLRAQNSSFMPCATQNTSWLAHDLCAHTQKFLKKVHQNNKCSKADHTTVVSVTQQQVPRLEHSITSRSLRGEWQRDQKRGRPKDSELKKRLGMAESGGSPKTQGWSTGTVRN